MGSSHSKPQKIKLKPAKPIQPLPQYRKTRKATSKYNKPLPPTPRPSKDAFIPTRPPPPIPIQKKGAARLQISKPLTYSTAFIATRPPPPIPSQRRPTPPRQQRPPAGIPLINYAANHPPLPQHKLQRAQQPQPRKPIICQAPPAPQACSAAIQYQETSGWFSRDGKRTRKGKPAPTSTAHHNVWLTANNNGRAIQLSDFELTQMKCTECIVCPQGRGHMTAERDVFVIHNQVGCSAAYHAGCARQIMRRAGGAMPRCVRCGSGMDIRDVGCTRKNPLGFEKFAGRR